MTRSLVPQRDWLWRSFWLALVLAGAVFLPFILFDKGYFIYYGDFNVQQIPFYQMAHDSVRSGDIFWSWTTDLGANFVGSYSFYLLGSPFFWLTLPFPSAVVPYLMGPLLVLKFACSSTAAYLYLRRFVKTDYALIGGLLYAFSGYSVYNVFFNHFHEAIIYFPLMLLGMEMYMKDNRRGVFAVAVFFSALSNYYFFIGQAIFLIIYWLMRMGSPDWQCRPAKFFWLAFEAVAGTAASAILLLPSYLAVLQNNRVDSLLQGWDLLIYNKPQRFWDIIHSFFFPQDIPARPTFFMESDNKWASMSAWLPVFSCCGAIAYFQSRKHTDWLRRLLIFCVFCTLIPALNAMFQLFNAMYYARWFYMMVLFLVLATMRCFEEHREIPVNWNRAWGWCFGITAFFALFIGLVPKKWNGEEGESISLGLYDHQYTDRFWIFVAIAMISLVLTLLLVRLFRQDRKLFTRWTLAAVACVSLIYSWYCLMLGKATGYYDADYVITYGIDGAADISLPDTDQTYRIDVHKGMDNQAMFWKLPCIQTFHSIVPGSVMEFYPSIGVTRSVGSRPDTTHYALRGLTSVRFLFDFADEDGTHFKKEEDFFYNEEMGIFKMPGWKYYDTQNGFDIYENEYYIPMGFTYDYMLSRSTYDAMSTSRRELALLKALVLEDEDVERFAELLPSITTVNPHSYTQSGYMNDCLDRRASAASSFVRDDRGFSAVISLPKENFVFFSVPYEEGWSATVNGAPAEIVRAGVGFMAVLCPAGEDVAIRFDYTTPGLKAGALISVTAVVLLAAYLVLWRFLSKRKTVISLPADQSSDFSPAFPPPELPGDADTSDHRSSI